MEDIILLLIIFLAGMYAGWKAHEAIIVLAIKHKPEDIEEAIRIARADRADIEDEVEITNTEGRIIKTKGVELAIESVGGHLYAYAKSNNQFIAQGETLEALLDTAHKRFPGKVFFGDVPEEKHQKS